MLKKDDVFSDLDLNKDYTPPEEKDAAAENAPVVDEVKDDAVVVDDVQKDKVEDTVPPVINADEKDTPPAPVVPEVTDDALKDEDKDVVPEGDEDLDDKSVEDLLKEIEESEDDIEEAKDDVKAAADASGDENLKAKVDELLSKVEEKDRLIERQKGSIDILGGEHSKLAKDYDLNKVRVNELESLISPIEDNNNLKALVAYTTKGDDGKEQRVEILKRMLAEDGYDVDAIEGERVRQEKAALGGNGGAGGGTNFAIGDEEQQEVFSDL